MKEIVVVTGAKRYTLHGRIDSDLLPDIVAACGKAVARVAKLAKLVDGAPVVVLCEGLILHMQVSTPN